MDRITCPTCGETHDLSDMQVGFALPDAWFAVPEADRDARVVATSDVVVIDGAHHFVRGVLEIPVRGEAQPFGWGIWVKVAAHDVGRAAGDPIHGRIATQLAGYPQTLGVSVRVRYSDPDLRPKFDVVDSAHQLATEQREGIHVERVLEHLSRCIHDDEPEPRGHAHFARLATDGWELDDALAHFLARDGVYWLPAETDRADIRASDLVKLLFAIEASDETGVPEEHRERMWVEVDGSAGEGPEARFTGILTNDPHVPGTTRAGMRVWFEPQHVIDVTRGETTLSKARDVLRCASHGVSQTTYVCQHLSRGSGLGFNQAADEGNPRPDAWCDACDAVFVEEGEWNDRSEAALGVKIICAGCYDAAEERNRRR